MSVVLIRSCQSIYRRKWFLVMTQTFKGPAPSLYILTVWVAQIGTAGVQTSIHASICFYRCIINRMLIFTIWIINIIRFPWCLLSYFASQCLITSLLLSAFLMSSNWVFAATLPAGFFVRNLNLYLNSCKAPLWLFLKVLCKLNWKKNIDSCWHKVVLWHVLKWIMFKCHNRLYSSAYFCHVRIT